MTRCAFIAAVAVCLFVAGPAEAQLSFTAAEFYSLTPSGESFTGTSFFTEVNDELSAADQATIQALTQQQGANQTWDFTTLTYPNEVTTSTTYFRDGDLAGLPGADEFPTANLAARNDSTDTVDEETTAYTYAQLTGDGQYISQGTYIPAESSPTGQEIVLRFEPDGLQQFTFPFTFGTVSEDQTQQTASGFTITTDFRTEGVGHGTLVTPAGSFEALMIEFQQTTTVAGQAATSRTYAWATKSGHGASASFSEGSGNTPPFASASYSTPGSGSGGGQNSAPVVSGPVEVSATGGETTTIDVLDAVSDPDDDDLTVTSVSDPDHGTAEIVDGDDLRLVGERVAYTPDAGYTGEDSFTFTVSDGEGGEVTGTVEVTVQASTSTAPEVEALAFVAAPNPARGATALRLTTAIPLDARVAVWDVLGREVAVLWDGPVSAGTQAFVLDTAGLAPGLYVARADMGDRSLTVRLTVAR